jgi:acyl-CoA synthetase (AMP-forming)/AMP-acid ligase II
MLGMMMDRPLLTSSILQHATRTWGDTEIVSRNTDGSLFRYRYRDMAARARRLANALRARGVNLGTRVATLAWNDHRHLEAYYAVPGIGAVLHTCNPRLHVDQLAYVLNHAQDAVLLFDPSFLPLVEAIASRCADIRHYVVLSDETPAVSSLPNLSSYEDWLADASDIFIWPEFDERTASGLCYTSGTTGNPKGVLYSHRSSVLHSLVLSSTQALGLASADTLLAVVPMFHVNAWGLPYAAPLNGCRLVLPGSQLDGASLFDLIDGERVTCAAGVPTVWSSLVAHMQANRLRPATMRRTVVGGAAVSEALVRIFAEQFGVEVRHAWGMTETSPLGTISASAGHITDTTAIEHLSSSVAQGQAVFGVELAIAGSDGERLPHDGRTRGELLVRGPWIASGYFNSDASPVRDGWLATGDIATIDASGCMRICDRVKDVIKSGGEWISSIDLENAAMAHADVRLAAAIAILHPKWDERPCLFIVRRDGATLDANALRAFLGARVAKWWLPDVIEFVDELPIGPTGKVHKQSLRAAYADGNFSRA